MVNYYTLTYTTKITAHNERIAKLYHIRQYNSQSVIIGSSRGKYGYNPDNKLFPKHTYNLSCNGLLIGEAELLLKELLKKKNIKQIFLTIDFFMFCNPEKIDRDLQYSVNSPFAFAGQLLSIDFFRKAIKKQKIRKSVYIDHANGFSGSAPISCFNTEQTYKESYRGKHYEYKTLDILGEIISQCHSHNIDLKIIINPSSILLWESLDCYNLYPTWEEWKRSIVKVNDEVSFNIHKPAFPMYDFAVYHPLTLEYKPIVGEKYLRYHMNPSHLSSRLGDIVISRVLGSSKYFNDFGKQINPSNIDQHILQQRALRKKVSSEVPEILNLLRK